MSYYNNGCGAAKKKPRRLLLDRNAKCHCGDYRYRHENGGIGACKDCDDCGEFRYDPYANRKQIQTKEAPVDKSMEQTAFENLQLRRRTNALVTLANSAKRFMDMLERLEKLAMEKIAADEAVRVRRPRGPGSCQRNPRNPAV